MLHQQLLRLGQLLGWVWVVAGASRRLLLQTGLFLKGNRLIQTLLGVFHGRINCSRVACSWLHWVCC